VDDTRDPLQSYRSKRDFTASPEPRPSQAEQGAALIFVVQKHAASRLHYDFRLELDGVLKSWAVPKGPSLDPREKRLAVQVEDHPLAYAQFAGEIPAGQYGAGQVEIWDRGTWQPLGDPREGLAAGQLKFRLQGEKLQGAWALIRMRRRAGEKQEPWLLIKELDAYTRPEAEFSVVRDRPDPLSEGTGVQVIPAGTSAALLPLIPAGFLPSSLPPIPAEVLPTSLPPIPAGALPSSLPPSLAPQLATLVDRVPTDDDWLYEIKFDGYRILTRIDQGQVALYTRNGHDWTGKLPALAAALAETGISSGWLDGEIVVLGADGMSDFGALQQALEGGPANTIRYYLFDLLFYNGFDLRPAPLMERRRLLAGIIGRGKSGLIRFSEDFAASGVEMLRSACRLGLEGTIGKRSRSPYRSGRSADWIKLKCVQRQEFVIVGYTERKGSKGDIGALLLGVYDSAGHLQYAGKAGSGFDRQTAAMLREKLQPLVVPVTALHEPPREAQGIWVKPQLVAEVSFAGWTQAGRIRHGAFQGLRSDKPPVAVIRERAQKTAKEAAQETFKEAARERTRGSARRAAPAVRKAPGLARVYRQTPAARFTGPPISSPDRIVDRSSGLRKLDLVSYYQLAAERILPQLADRPLSFVRAPAGIDGPIFFQKHGSGLKIPQLRLLDPNLDPGHPALMAIDSPAALLGAVQMNVLEFHTWNATLPNLGQPDRLVFDLDPGEGLLWAKMLQAAGLVRVLLTELGLESFLKTSGGKGLHIVVPILPNQDWQTAKGFSRSVSRHLARVLPSLFTAVQGPANRVGKIFVDYNRNGQGATTVAAYSVRARPGLGISIPCSWSELAGLRGGDHWTVRNAADRLTGAADPWREYATTRQDLEPVLAGEKGQRLLRP